MLNMIAISRRLKFLAIFLFLFGFFYLLAFVDLLTPLDYFSPISFAEDPILAVLNSTFSYDSTNANETIDIAAKVLYSPLGSFEAQNQSLPYCPVTPPNLKGPIKVWLDTPSMSDLNKLYPDLENGGHGHPINCKARHKVAIIVPYRDRQTQLQILLHNLHSFLRKQQIDYSIFIVEQIANQTFNRAKLMNVGFIEALKLYNWQCFIFHDVDLLPENDHNLYTCPEQPRHMSVLIDKFGYKLPYSSIFGGISALTRQQLERINGFSNDYWGWGGEDDDLSTRVKINGYKISRYSGDIGRYKMIKHKREKSNPVNECRHKLMDRTRIRFRTDGLSNCKYKIINSTREHLFTHYVVDLLEKESRERLRDENYVFREC